MFRSAVKSAERMQERDLAKSDVSQVNNASSQSTIDGRQQISVKNASSIKPPAYQTGGGNEEPVPFFSLFRFASKKDVVLIIISIAAALLNGLCFPISVILFGRLSGAFVEYASSHNATQGLEELSGNSSLTDDIVSFCVGTAAIHAISVLLSFLFVAFLNIAAESQVFQCRDRCVKAVLSQEIGWYDTETTDGFTASLSTNLSKMQDGIGEKLGMVITNFAIALFCIISSFYHGWELTLINSIALPVLAATTGMLSKKVATLSMKEASAYALAGSLAEEVISAIRTVAMFSAEKKEVEKFEAALKPAEKAGIRRGTATAIGSGALWLITYSSYALSFWYGVGLVFESDSYDAASLNIIFFNMLFAAIKLGLLLPFIEAIGSARIAASSVFRIIDRVPLIDASSFISGQTPAKVSGNIKFEDVSFNYPSRPNVQTLRGVTFQVAPGETVALVGASGSGKSTCVQLLQRFYDPIQGWIQLDGRDIKDLDVAWLRSQIGVVGQEPVLFRQSIRENIRLGAPPGVRITNDDVEQAARMANAHDFIQRLPQGYDTMLGDRGTLLSGGQKQRIAIARALIRQPKILLLDEATSALDNESEAIVQQALDEALQGRTTIIVAHRLSTIRNADRILVFNQGVIEEVGDHESLMARKGIYYRLVDREDHSETSDDNDLAKPPTPAVSITKKTAATQTKKILSLPKVWNNKKDDEEEDDEDVSFFQVLQWSRPEWKFLTAGIWGSIMLGASIPLYALVYGEVMGLLSKGDDGDVYARTEFLSLMFVVVALVAGTGAFVQIFMFSLAGERLTCRMRKQIYEALLCRPIAWFDRPENSAGALCSQLATDATAIQGLTGTRFGLLIQVFVSITVALILSLVWSWRLALASAALVPVVLVSAIVGMRMGGGDSNAKVKVLEKSAGVASEAIANIRTVVSLGQEATFHSRYMEALKESRSRAKRNAALRGLLYGFTSNASAFASIVCMGYGGYLIQYGGLSYKEVFKTCEALIFGMEMIGQAMALTPNYGRAKMAAARIFELIQRKPTSDQQELDALNSITGKVTFDEVHFRYPTRTGNPVLQGLSANIEPGSTIALVGRSGCGKSTCIQLLQRFYDADRGTVSVDDRDVRSFTMDSYRHHLGIVSQEPVLFNRTIAENIAYGDQTRTPELAEIVDAAKKANIHSFIQSLPLGYQTNVGKGGMQLSGGQKQRIAIARMLLRNPEVLLLDEATSALDGESERVVQDALFNASEGRTCIVVAHRLSTIRNADRILVLHKGRVHEEGTHEELISQLGMYHALWDIQ